MCSSFTYRNWIAPATIKERVPRRFFYDAVCGCRCLLLLLLLLFVEVLQRLSALNLQVRSQRRSETVETHLVETSEDDDEEGRGRRGEAVIQLGPFLGKFHKLVGNFQLWLRREFPRISHRCRRGRRRTRLCILLNNNTTLTCARPDDFVHRHSLSLKTNASLLLCTWWWPMYSVSSTNNTILWVITEIFAEYNCIYLLLWFYF